MELNSKKIFSLCAGFSMLLLSCSAFVLSIRNGFADSGHSANFKNSIFQSSSGNGKYMMNYQVFKYKDGGEGYNILVWDSQTGRAKIYYYSSSEKKMKVWNEGAIPSNPLD